MTPLCHIRNEERLKAMSCIISDCIKWDTVTVHTFILVVLSRVKTEIPLIKKVVYFSDGAASHYLSYHKQDIKLGAEWHFLPLVMAEAHVMEWEALLNVLLPGQADKQQYYLIFLLHLICSSGHWKTFLGWIFSCVYWRVCTEFSQLQLAFTVFLCQDPLRHMFTSLLHSCWKRT